jgi:hypothetical protein
LALVLVASAAVADPNNAGMKSWTNNLGGARATYAEVEPNDTCPGQQVYCGDDVNPAYLEANGADWYTFTANAGDLLTLATYSINGSSVDTVIELYSDNCTTMLASNDDNPYPWSLISNYAAPYTGAYNLKVRGFGSAYGDYGVSFRCVGAPPPQENDLCSGAIDIPRCSAGTITGDTYTYHNDYDPGSGGCASGYPEAGKDAVYVMNLVAGDIVDLTYTQLQWDTAFYVVTDCANVAGSCVAGADDTFSGEPEVIHYVAGASGLYYLILDSYGTDSGGPWVLDFTITCSAPEACCFDDGTCQMLMAGDCTAQGGHPQGNGTTCEGVVCEVVPNTNTTWGQIRAQYR